jgi:signal peptidase I
VLQQVPLNSISVGNIIVYRPPCAATGFSVIHRVVGISQGGFITKGDNNGITDQAAGIASGPVTSACIEGKVVFVIPYIERLADLPYGINYVIAALIIVGVLYGELRGGREEGESPETATPP